jgi:hypothetical protein
MSVTAQHVAIKNFFLPLPLADVWLQKTALVLLFEVKIRFGSGLIWKNSLTSGENRENPIKAVG